MAKWIKDNVMKFAIICVATAVVLVFIVIGIAKIATDKTSNVAGSNNETSESTTNIVDNVTESSAEETQTDTESTSGASQESIDSEASTQGTVAEDEATSAVVDDDDDKEGTTDEVSSAPTQSSTEAPTKAPDISETISEEDAEEQFKESGGTYVDNPDGTVSITGGDVEGELIIPATIDGKTVELAENAFAIMGYGNDSITSVEINAAVIGACAFQNCTSLKTVIIGENVKEIGNGAFANCPELETVVFKGEGITELPEYVFMSCPKMTSITLPKSITKVHLGFVTSYEPYVLEAYPEGYIGTPDYESIVPEFTLYTYSKPGEITVWSNQYGIEYTEYDGLEAIGTEIRKANFKVEYLE